LENKLEVIQIAEDLENMMKTQGWKHLNKWVNEQRESSKLHMEREAVVSNSMNILGIFNNYVKYIFIVAENRAYNKQRTFIEVVIANGKKHKEELSKEE